MAFSINQVRHLFVASSLKDSADALAAVGDTFVGGVAGQQLYVQHFGHGGVICSDKIDVQNIMYAKASQAANTILYQHIVTVNTAMAGQSYMVKVYLQNYMGISPLDNTVKLATYLAPSGATAASIAKGLRVALRSALGFQKADSVDTEAAEADALVVENYREQLFTVSGTGANIIISEVAPYWELGKFPAGHVIRIPEGAVTFGDIADASGTLFNTWASDVYDGGDDARDASKKLADLEYFHVGARGDEYRQMGFPYNINTKYEVDPTATYAVIDIHYFYQGSNEAVQKSEKDLILVVPTDFASGLVEDINAMTGFAQGDPRFLQFSLN